MNSSILRNLYPATAVMLTRTSAPARRVTEPKCIDRFTRSINEDIASTGTEPRELAKYHEALIDNANHSSPHVPPLTQRKAAYGNIFLFSFLRKGAHEPSGRAAKEETRGTVSKVRL